MSVWKTYSSFSLQTNTPTFTSSLLPFLLLSRSHSFHTFMLSFFPYSNPSMPQSDCMWKLSCSGITSDQLSAHWSHWQWIRTPCRSKSLWKVPLVMKTALRSDKTHLNPLWRFFFHRLYWLGVLSNMPTRDSLSAMSLSYDDSITQKLIWLDVCHEAGCSDWTWTLSRDCFYSELKRFLIFPQERKEAHPDSEDSALCSCSLHPG